MAAVEVIAGYKYYGSAKNPNKKIVLDQLDMNVMHGSIYGLLGASGCGKTTLLSCIVGRKKLNNGVIKVFGIPPGEPGSGIPGPRVGYMPQDIALLDEFSVAETIIYFGRLYGMSETRIYERYNELSQLLDLPDGSRSVVKCSGGQQRRVSFACALVHEPELLILDEPTVGLDPLLRERIWQYLLETTKNSKLAVIITTHYIEETKMAHRVGLMRNGILLAEDTPQSIISLFQVDSLEDAFLKLCQRQGISDEAGGLKRVTRVSTSESTNTVTENGDTGNETITDDIIKVAPALDDFTGKRAIKRNKSFMEQRPSGLRGKVQFTSVPRMKALLSKNILQIVRQPAALIFCFLFPIVQLTCFYTAIGGNPKGLKLGIVNEEVPNYNDCLNDTLVTAFAHDFTCDFHKVSCRFIAELDGSTLEKVFFSSVEEAYQASRNLEISGFLRFHKNFTESMSEISTEGRFAQNSSFDNYEIGIRLDMSDQQIAYYLERRILETYKNFSKNLMIDCQYPENLAEVPIHFYEPIYGSFKDEYKTFIAPGVIMTMVFFLATLATSTIFITERLEGTWDRVLVAGISAFEMLFAHIFVQAVILTLQCAEVMLVAAYLFGNENKGDNLTILFLLVLLGFCGMLFGLLISILCDSHTMASFVSTGSFYPMVIMCGLLWPLEGMPVFLKYIAWLLPFTIPSISARNILVKGWSITHFEVYGGFCVVLGWIIVFAILCVLGLKMTK